MQCIESLFKPYKKKKISLSGLTDELLSIYINKLFKEQKQNILVVTSTLFEADELYQSLIKYNDKTLFFPMDDFLTSEAIAISPDLKITRLETINNVLEKKEKKIVITHLMGFLHYLPTKELWLKKTIKLKKNMEIDKNELVEALYDMGYLNETLVTKTGEIANRGFVVDIFPIKEENPIRIEFWGNTIETIKYFNLETQRSIKEIEDIIIYPFDEFLSEENSNQIIRKQKYLPLYNKTVTNIGGYLDEPIIIYKDYNQIEKAYLQLREEIHNYHINNDQNIDTNYMHNLEDVNYQKEIYVMGFDNLLSNITVDFKDVYNSRNLVPYHSNFQNINRDLKHYLEIGKTLIICLDTDYQINNFLAYLKHSYVLTNEKDIKRNKINIIKKDINKGYMIDDYVVMSSFELFKDITKKKIFKSNFKYGSKIKNINKLNIGDYVVHSIHGIGIYGGIKTLTKKGIKKDYIQITYKDNDKLYIPVEKIDTIYKYTSKEGYTPHLHKLGGSEWQKTKLRIRNKLRDIADKLLTISALRMAKKGYRFSKDSEEQLLFEADFMYEETKDQLLVTKGIKKDMESDIPMDRLLCGDVGYGKTEVAFRAIFKAVNDSKQVCYLCPTTILSHQQYMNALERFKKYPINIALLNRFTSPKEVKEILEKLKTGRIDVIFGTHRLLSNDVKFKDLGLLIVDEEQRFGVIHKEKIKEYKNNVDILTLSATPIPRTLQLSLAGLRSLSLIETPPMNRFPVQTYVLEENNYIIKDAIYKELSRKGQIFFLYNRVNDIENKVIELQRLVPQARITYAHGKMNKKEIEDKMMKFINYEFDLLVCTTIIETGIDIANVNTLIVIDADKFGLSQLYQIRGRVGRSNKIAYAYLMYKKNKVLTEEATKRLKVIKEFTELGSGFSIALRDLSIRGAGDILGREQAGFIDTVGIELYLKMLNEEVAKLKGQEIEEETIQEEQPLLNVETYIDDNYVKDLDLKIEIHKMINEIDSYQKLIEVKKELEDRFGKVSESLLIYMYQEWFEKMARLLNIEKVNQTKNVIELIFSKEGSDRIKFNKIYNIYEKKDNLFEFSYQQNRFKIKLDYENLKKHWLYYLVELLDNIAN